MEVACPRAGQNRLARNKIAVNFALREATRVVIQHPNLDKTPALGHGRFWVRRWQEELWCCLFCKGLPDRGD